MSKDQAQLASRGLILTRKLMSPVSSRSMRNIKGRYVEMLLILPLAPLAGATDAARMLALEKVSSTS